MIHLLLAFCIGMLPALIVSTVIVRKATGESELLRERIAAEEASKRHFMQLASKHDETIALMHQEQKRLEIECTLLRAQAPRVAAA